MKHPKQDVATATITTSPTTTVTSSTNNKFLTSPLLDSITRRNTIMGVNLFASKLAMESSKC